MSLDKFAQSCGVTNISKTIYCYEKWSSPLQIAKATIFPEYKDFSSSLTKVKEEKNVEEFIKLVNSRLRADIWKSLEYAFFF